MISKLNYFNLPFLLKKSCLTLKIIAFALLFITSVNIASFAQDHQGHDDEQKVEINPDTVVAIVDGEKIIEGDLAYAAEDLAQELAQVPPAERKAFLISVLIDMKVMAKAAKKEKMQKTDSYKRRLNYLEDRALRRAYFTEIIGKKITPELVQSAYDKFVSEFKPAQEMRARHILVALEDDAKNIIKEIENGKPFEISAMENSTDGSARNGGDLGYFGLGTMTPPFEEATLALEIGQISEPIKTQFGWHIIKLEDKRLSKPPSLEQLQGQLAQNELIGLFNEAIKDLKKDTKIEIIDPEIATKINLQQGQ